MSITFLARFALFWFGGDDDDNPLGPGRACCSPGSSRRSRPRSSRWRCRRSREYQADESGAILSRDPDALASALRKLEATAKQVPVPQSVTPAEAHLFIVNPFRGRQATASFASLFWTHPPTEARVARLAEIKRELV